MRAVGWLWKRWSLLFERNFRTESALCAEGRRREAPSCVLSKVPAVCFAPLLMGVVKCLGRIIYTALTGRHWKIKVSDVRFIWMK
jgi:hypothetical protein